jgi:hypothetical protein
MNLLHPFGDGINDINIVGMGEAVVVGMEKDSQIIEESLSHSNGAAHKRQATVNGHHSNDDEQDVYAGLDQSHSTIDGSHQDGAGYYAIA